MNVYQFSFMWGARHVNSPNARKAEVRVLARDFTEAHTKSFEAVNSDNVKKRGLCWTGYSIVNEVRS